MTSLLTHTVAHSTRPSFRPKTNNQPLKTFLCLEVSLKVVKNHKIQTFKFNFLCQKLSKAFQFFFFIEEFDFRVTLFVIDIFWILQFLNHLIFFTQLNSSLKNFLRGWLLVLGLKECLVEWQILCVKSEVILTRVHGWMQT